MPTLPGQIARSGGPRTASGKAAAAKNALTTGVAAVGWLNVDEDAQYQDLVASLLHQYPLGGAQAAILIELAATAQVKWRRLQRGENALYAKARLYNQAIALERADNSVAALLPDTPQGHEQALALMGDGAMPDPIVLDRLERYQITQTRQVLQLLGQLGRLQSESQPTGNDVRDVRDGQQDVQDVQAKAPKALVGQGGRVGPGGRRSPGPEHPEGATAQRARAAR